MLEKLKNGRCYYLPAEFSNHLATIAMLPYRNDIWRENAFYAQRVIIDVINIISKHEKVYLCRSNKVKKNNDFSHTLGIEILDIEYDDIWARDISPFFFSDDNTLAGMTFNFNAWGGIDEGSYYPWDDDNSFADNICDLLKIKKYYVNLVIEGGAIITNGRGVLITTESVLLNKNRNPFASKEDFEKVFKEYFGIQKVIWLKRGFIDDETDGHVDVFLNFVDEINIFLAWTDDTKNIQYEVVHEAYEILSQETSVSGNPFIIHKLLMPEPIYITKEEAKGIVVHESAIPRLENTILYPTYNNSYVFNGGVIVPIFNSDQDKHAIELYKKHFIGRKIYPIYSKELLIGGGNFHCVLHEIPEVGK